MKPTLDTVSILFDGFVAIEEVVEPCCVGVRAGLSNRALHGDLGGPWWVVRELVFARDAEA